VVAIGVGGGFDLLTALYFDASEVTGVEVNGATLDILRRVYRDYTKHWVTDPRVTLVEDDGRHFLAASDRAYDVIQLSGVDSYSGTPGAAHVFSENYLYTAEAFDLYLSRLSDEGIVNMMRLEWKPPREMLRALVTLRVHHRQFLLRARDEPITGAKPTKSGPARSFFRDARV
jgi:spermidine synthase